MDIETGGTYYYNFESKYKSESLPGYRVPGTGDGQKSNADGAEYVHCLLLRFCSLLLLQYSLTDLDIRMSICVDIIVL